MYYVLSFALQLSGGVILLLLWVFTDASKKIVESYYPEDTIAQPDDDNMCNLKKEKLQEIATDIYRNRFAFADLCVGYLIAAVAEKTLSNCVNFIWVFVSTSIITSIEYYIAGFLARRNFPEDTQVPVSKFRERGVSTFASNREVNEMLDEIYGEK